MKKRLLVLAALLVVAGATAVAAFAGSSSVTYKGQGLTAGGDGSYVIQQEICGVANGADVEGSYLHWVLTGAGIASAQITGPWGTVDMTANGGGSFYFNSDWYDPLSSLIGTVSATYTYSGRAPNAQLVISHGCAPTNNTGAWCSPGFWKNTLQFSPNAWDTIGVDPTSTGFNGNVSPAYYANDLNPDALLTDVLNNPTQYGGTLGAAGPYGLTAFNAVGAYLTDQIPGYTFDPSLVGTDDSCPLDAHGDFKTS